MNSTFSLRSMARESATTFFKGKLEFALFMKAMHESGVKTLFLVTIGLSAFGAVLTTMARLQAMKFVGNLAAVGPPYFELMVREFAPLTVSLLVASRVAAWLGAETSAMKVTEQIDALRLFGISPVSTLVAPRVFALALCLPLLTALGTVAALLVAVLMATYVYSSDGRAFIDPQYIGTSDIMCAVLKSVASGLVIPIVASREGLISLGGSQAVGNAVTQAVVRACVWVLMIDFSVTAVFFMFGI